jgi:hypothetical protein
MKQRELLFGRRLLEGEGDQERGELKEAPAHAFDGQTCYFNIIGTAELGIGRHHP